MTCCVNCFPERPVQEKTRKAKSLQWQRSLNRLSELWQQEPVPQYLNTYLEGIASYWNFASPGQTRLQRLLFLLFILFCIAKCIASLCGFSCFSCFYSFFLCLSCFSLRLCGFSCCSTVFVLPCYLAFYGVLFPAYILLFCFPQPLLPLPLLLFVAFNPSVCVSLVSLAFYTFPTSFVFEFFHLYEETFIPFAGLCGELCSGHSKQDEAWIHLQFDRSMILCKCDRYMHSFIEGAAGQGDLH